MALQWRGIVRALAGVLLALRVSSVAAEEHVLLRLAPLSRVDDLVWSIADPSGTPNILSELTWSSLLVAGLDADIAVPLGVAVDLLGRARAGWILSGDNQDSDYLSNDRQGEFSRSSNNASGGLVWDASLALGYWIAPRGGRLSFEPMLGFEVAQERLRMTGGYQTIPANGPFPGLDSRYIATWWGPWIGSEARYLIDGGILARLSFAYQLLGYYGRADWNLRNDFQHPKSFDHKAVGQALRATAGVDIPLSARAWFSIEGDLALGSTDKGTDRTFFASGAVGETTLNGVGWRTLGGSAGIRWWL